MPCNCDYLEARNTEVESRDAAKHIVYINSKLPYTKTENWIVKASKEYYGNEERLNDLVVILCKLCHNLGPILQEKIIYNGNSKQARALADWWEEHQEADKQRIKEENKELAKKKALAKLTEVERQLLGFR